MDIIFRSPYVAPTLLEIVDTDSRKIVKLAYIVHSDSTGENQLANIYNLIANDKGEKIVFSNYLNFSTKDWPVLKKESITYKISPYKKINEDEIEQQQRDIRKLCGFFETAPIPTVYYSCRNPVELFQIRGFDYVPNMYMAKVGGIVYPGNQVFSGRDQEVYTHEKEVALPLSNYNVQLRGRRGVERGSGITFVQQTARLFPFYPINRPYHPNHTRYQHNKHGNDSYFNPKHLLYQTA